MDFNEDQAKVEKRNDKYLSYAAIWLLLIVIFNLLYLVYYSITFK